MEVLSDSDSSAFRFVVGWFGLEGLERFVVLVLDLRKLTFNAPHKQQSRNGE